MSKYQFAVLDPEMLYQVVPMRLEMGAYSRSGDLAYLTWKYLKNPYLTDPLVFVVRSEGKVVAMRGIYGTSWIVPGTDKPQTIPCSADTAIAPEHRSAGLFADLTEFMESGLADRGYRYVINMGATPANHVASIVNLRWQKVGSYEPLVRSTRSVGTAGPPQATARTASLADPLLRRLKKSQVLRKAVRQARTARRNTFGPSPFSGLDKHVSAGKGPTSLEVASEPRPQAMARLAERFDDPERIHHLRDEDYFAWRYGNPLVRDRWFQGRLHRRFVFLGVGEGEGYAVFQGMPAKPEVQLVDWAGDGETFAELLGVAIELIQPAQLSTWGATLAGSIKTELGQSGFVADERGPQTRWQGLLLNALSSGDTHEPTIGSSKMLDMNSWDLRMIHSDATN
jgi:hypothetical protein